MTRMTAQRCNGIKTGYWSQAKKEDLVQRLGAYEDTGLEPEDVRELLGTPLWINPAEQLPLDGERVLCVTKTKSGLLNLVIGYWDAKWSNGAGRWACGMNSNVVRWSWLPQLPEV